jgi:purine-binding chemotaxis protein CheW
VTWTGPAVRAIVLPLGEDRCAVPVLVVREVVAAPRITPLATAPAAVLGLLNLRGDVLPVLDTPVLLGRPPLGEAAFGVVVECATADCALVTSGFPALADLGAPVDAADAADGTSGTYQVDGRLVTLLDVDALLARGGLVSRGSVAVG